MLSPAVGSPHGISHPESHGSHQDLRQNKRHKLMAFHPFIIISKFIFIIMSFQVADFGLARLHNGQKFFDMNQITGTSW